MATARDGYENKRNCSECGQRFCKAEIDPRCSNETQAHLIRMCQDTNWKPIKR